MNTPPESRLAERLRAAYPPAEENADLTRTVLQLRTAPPRAPRVRNALLMTAAAAAVVLVVAIALPRRAPQESTLPNPSSASSLSATTPAPAAVSLADRTWQIPGSRATFYLHGSQLSLSNGCQLGQASAAVAGDTVKLGNLQLSAGPVCSPDQPTVGGALWADPADGLLQWSISGNRLTLTGLAKGTSLTYVDAGAGKVEPTIAANTAVDVTDLENSSWTVPGTADALLTFAAGKFRASGHPCVIGGTTITLSQIVIAAEDVTCGSGTSDAPSAFSFLHRPLRWHLQDGLLLLTDGTGQAQQWIRSAGVTPTRSTVPGPVTSSASVLPPTTLGPSTAVFPTPVALADRTWQIPGSRATLYLHDHQLTLFDGCQTASAVGTIVDNRLVIDHRAMSAGGVCGPDQSAVTGALLVDAFLTDGAQEQTMWSLAQDRLTVTAGATSLTYADAGLGHIDVTVAPNTSADIDQLADSSWQLPGGNFRLTFADGRVQGQVSTCRPLDGPATISLDTITVQSSGPTQCSTPNSSMTGQQTLRWHLDGDLLLLTDPDGITTQWAASTAPVSSTTPSSASGFPAAFSNHSWQVPGSQASIIFHPDGQVWMTTGCRGQEATLTKVTADALEFTPGMVSTGGGCLSTYGSKVSQAVFTGRVLHWSLAAGRLTLRDDSGNQLTYLDAGVGVDPSLTIEPNAAAEVKTLASSSWQVPGSSDKVTIANGRITASIETCDAVSGAVTITSTTLTVAHPDPLPSGCVPPAGSPNFTADFTFGPSLHWHLDGDLLLLTDASGNATQWVPAG